MCSLLAFIFPFCIVLITQFLTQPLAFLFTPHYNSAFLKSYSAILKKKKKPLTLSTFSKHISNFFSAEPR